MTLRPLSRRLVTVASTALVLAAAACAHSVDDPGVAPELGVPATKPEAKNACVETTCPAPWATCAGAAPCTVDVRTDVRNCGACGNPCPRLLGGSATVLCVEGTCQIACAAGNGDCNGVLKDGCETNLEDDPKNCGGCGITCDETSLCWRGACGCPKGFTQCGTECKKLDSDDDNCAACGQRCTAPADPNDPRWICGPEVTPPETKWTCASSSCNLQCKPGRGDCNKQFCADGCEIDLLRDPQNCGTCGHACEAGQFCANGTCLCPPGTTRCGDECVDTAKDPMNCGACGYACPGGFAMRPGQPSTGGPLCDDGECKYVCFPGYADCDRDLDNGCETDLTKSQRHCGACGTSCDVKAGQPCVAGACLTKPCEIGPVR